jgi:hypothetical protein
MDSKTPEPVEVRAQTCSWPKELAQLAKASLKNKKAELAASLHGFYSEHFRWIVDESDWQKRDGRRRRNPDPQALPDPRSRPAIYYRVSRHSCKCRGDPSEAATALTEPKRLCREVCTFYQNHAWTERRNRNRVIAVLKCNGERTGTHEPRGRKVRAQFAHVWGVRRGRVVRFQQYTDTKQFAEVVAE